MTIALSSRNSHCGKFTLKALTAAALAGAAVYFGAAGGASATTFNVSDDASLRTAINNAFPGDTINLTANITITGGDLPAIVRSVTIEGNNFTLNGNNAARGLFIYSGGVAINNLTITGAVAQGGAGGLGAQFGGAGGGGGAGLGGGIFVASGAALTTSNVQVTNSSAIGGAGAFTASGVVAGGGGGGGLGGAGGSSQPSPSGVATGGGGGVGSSANGGSALAPAGVGIVNTFAGGGNTTAASGGAAGGGGAQGSVVPSTVFGGAAGGGVAGSDGTTSAGGAGGFGGGGGGGPVSFTSSFPGGPAGNGGFGGGGGGGSSGIGGAGGFGAGGGGGGINFSSGAAGFGGAPGTAGTPSGLGLGGAGAGMGGGIFVQQGGSLTLGAGSISGNTVTGGLGGSGFGSAYGSGMFLQGNGFLNLSPGLGATQTINNVIADQSGSGGTGANAGSWSVLMNGPGTVNLGGINAFSGDLFIGGGTLNTTVNGALYGQSAAGPGNVNVFGGTLGLGGTFQAVSSLTNNGGAVTMAGGILDVTGPGGLANNGSLSGYGNVQSQTGPMSNTGTITVGANQTLNFQGPTALQNDGVIDLGGGKLQAFLSIISPGTTALNNATGLLTGSGTVVGNFVNSGAGTIAVENGQHMTISNGFTNNGLVQMDGSTAFLISSNISNTGMIQGLGHVNAFIDNTGQITSSGGALTLGNLITNDNGGIITVTQGSTLNLLATGAIQNFSNGVISVAGGTLSQGNNTTVQNFGVLSGYGVFTGGSLENFGKATFAGGTATITQVVTNGVGGFMTVDHAPAIFNKAVTNNGTFTVNGTTATFNAAFTNNGSFVTDPATLVFADLTQGTGGSIQASAGDIYKVSGNFNNNSTQNTTWDTIAATLEFICPAGSCTGIAHNLLLAGLDKGAVAAGLLNNFAWGTLTIDAGNILNLLDGNVTPGGAFYADSVVGALILGNLITNIDGNGFNIYYDPSFAANAYLGGKTYLLACLTDVQQCGELIPIGASTNETPLPAALPLFASGLGALGFMTWRRKKKKAARAA